MKIIYNPKLEEIPGSRPIRFPRAINRTPPNSKKSSNTLELPEMVGSWIIPGINEISQEEWDYMSGLEEVKDRLKAGVFRVLTPNVAAEEITDTLADFSLPDAREIINNTFDIDWLQLAQNQDNRKEVQKWCLQKIKDIRAKIEKRSA